jgi:hypothetical protein
MLPNWRWFNEEWMRDFTGPRTVRQTFYNVNNVYDLFTNVYDLFANVYDLFTNVYDLSTNVSEYPEKTTDLPQVPRKLYHIML